MSVPRHTSGLSRRLLLSAAAAAPLAACASTPDLAPYLDGDDGTLKQQILGSRQPLTQRQQNGVLSGLSAEQRGDALDRQSALQEALSEAPMVGGNAVQLLRDGAQALPAMFQAMGRAHDHINLEYFIFSDVVWQGTSITRLLADKLQQGVRVNLIYDGFGSKDTPAPVFDTLRKAGAQIVEFNPLNPLAARAGWSPNDRDHRKILVVDGEIGFTGGINMDKVYENPPRDGIPANGDTAHAYWRDTAVRIEGPAVGELQKLFFGTWREQKGPPVHAADYFPKLKTRGVQTVRIIGSSPGHERPLYFISLMTAVLSAEKRAWLSTGYFVPPHEEREEFYKVARRGIDLRFVLPSHSDVAATVYAARAAYGDLLGSGAHIYEMQTAVLHSKLATVDGVWSVVGSSNLDRRSVVFNNEVDAIILGRETAAQLEATLREDMAESREITLARWRERSLGERVDEWRARLWQYWM